MRLLLPLLQHSHQPDNSTTPRPTRPLRPLASSAATPAAPNVAGGGGGGSGALAAGAKPNASPRKGTAAGGAAGEGEGEGEGGGEQGLGAAEGGSEMSPAVAQMARAWRDAAAAAAVGRQAAFEAALAAGPTRGHAQLCVLDLSGNAVRGEMVAYVHTNPLNGFNTVLMLTIALLFLLLLNRGCATWARG